MNADTDEDKIGMTWKKYNHLPTFGIDSIGCDNGGGGCNPYKGDTSCNVELPVICIRFDQSPRPAYAVIGDGYAMAPEFYQGWAEGHIKTTTPVRGSQFKSINEVNAFCVSLFGEGWRTAEFHDGKFISGMNNTLYAGDSWKIAAAQQQHGGWRFYAYGDIRGDTRFWAHINDQTSTCWSK